MKKLIIGIALLTLLIPMSVLALGDGPTKDDGDLIASINSGTITDGGVSFTIDPADDNGDANVDFVVNGHDHMWGAWWWYRILNDTAETILPAPDAEDYTGNVATLTWANVDSRGFSAVMTITLTDTSGGAGTSGTVLTELIITNNSGADLSLDIFTYAEIDVDGTSSNESATLNTANYIIDFYDETNPTIFQFRSNFTDQGAYEVAAWPAVREALMDSSVTNFTNSGLPASGDIGGAFQDQTRTIANGDSATYTAGYGVDAPAPSAVSLNSLEARRGPQNWPTYILLVTLPAIIGAFGIYRRRKQVIAN